MTVQANKHRVERVFQVGDMVYIELQPYYQTSVVARECPKLAAKYYGPYKIVDRIGSCAYKVDLPIDAAIHPVLHVSQLKFALTSYQAASSLPPLALLTSLLRPLEILDRKLVKRENSAATQWLIQRKNSSPANATREFVEDFQMRFLDLISHATR